MLCIPGNKLAENPHHAKKHKNHKGVWKPLLYGDTFCMLIWCTSQTDESQQTNPLWTVQVLSNSWICLLWWSKNCWISSQNSDFSGDLPWYPHKASPNKSKNIRICKVFPCVFSFGHFWNQINWRLVTRSHAKLVVPLSVLKAVSPGNSNKDLPNKEKHLYNLEGRWQQKSH